MIFFIKERKIIMKEIEVEVTFDNTKAEVMKILSRFDFIGKKDISDTYYCDPLRKNLQPETDLRLNETFRVRKTKEKCFLTYKKQHFKGKLWVYSDEYETKVEDSNTIKKIIMMLGLKPLIKVNNKRRVYRYKDFEIELEDVENLGIFIEVEKLCDTENDEMKIKEEIRNFIRSLNLKNVRELNIGKNQYLLSLKMNRNLKLYNDTKYD